MTNDSTDSCGHCSGAAVPDAGSGIGRRTFLAQSALLAAAAALAACGMSDATAPELTGQASIKVSDYPALSSVGGIAMVTIQGSPLAIVRTGTSTYVALSRICPHAGSTVNQSGSGFLCPNHGAQFSANGTWVGGQPTSSLRSYATSYDAASATLTIG
ncbi:MAG TPA: Rieske (2Fe-2S) protein [Gemmatimonadaceae bacterium]|nr:Rieske (2Fe-2S) protein [Gemmatimonadaceae bacterium]